MKRNQNKISLRVYLFAAKLRSVELTLEMILSINLFLIIKVKICQ